MDYSNNPNNKDNLTDLSDIEFDLPNAEPQEKVPLLSAEDQRYIADFGRLIIPYLCDDTLGKDSTASEQDTKNFGQYTRALRTAAGFSRQALANTVGWSEAQIAALENGLLPPNQLTESLLNDLALTFRLDVAELYLMLGQYNRLETTVETQSTPYAPQPTSEAAANQLSMLHEINLKMNREIHLEPMLHTALVEAIRVIGADAGLIYLVEPSNLTDLEIKAQWSSDETVFNHSAELQRSVEYVISTGDIYHCPDIFEDALPNSAVDEELFCALLCVPIRTRRRVCGVMVMVSPSPYYFTISDEQFLLALSDKIATTLTFHMLREVGTTLALLNQKQTLIRIVQLACYLMGSQSGAVVLIDPDTNEPLQNAVKFPSDEFTPRSHGLSRLVASSTELYHVFDARQDPLIKSSTKDQGIQTILGMKIQIQHEQEVSLPKTIGIIFINTMRLRQFDGQDIDLLQNLAGQAAIAIENSTLFEASRQRCNQLSYIISRLTSLHEATQQIRSNRDINDLLCLIASEAAQLVQADAADVFLRDKQKNQLVYCGCYQLKCHIIDGACFQVGRSFTDKVIAEGSSIIMNRLDKEVDYENSAYAQESITAVIGVPLRLTDEAEGTLMVYSQQPAGFFTQQAQQVLSLLVAQVAVIIQTALNVRHHYQYTRTIEAWHEGTLRLTGRNDLPALVKLTLTHAVELVKAKGGRLYLVDKGQEEFTLIETTEGLEDTKGITVPIGNSVIGQVIKTARPVSICNYRKWPDRVRDYDQYNFGTVVGLPIICGGEVWGAISIHDDREDRNFSEEELRLLTHFGQLAALMMENLDQLSTDITKLSRLKTLAQANREIIGQGPLLSCRERLKLAAMHIMKILAVNNCEISFLSRNKTVLKGVFSQRQSSRVIDSFIELPGDYIQHEIGTLAPYLNRQLTIPWQNNFLEQPGDWMGDQGQARFPWLKVPLLKQNEHGKSVIGLIQVTHSPKQPNQMAFEFGYGFSYEDDWLLRVFADAVTLVIDDNVMQDNLLMRPELDSI